MDFLPTSFNYNYNTCAVVSSSPRLLNHEYGEEIDAHDAIFRVNLAPTNKYEKHVGSRTTIRIGVHISYDKSGIIPADDFLIMRFPIFPTLEEWVRNRTHLIDWYEDNQQNYPVELGYRKVYLMTLEFMKWSRECIFKRLEGKAKANPTSGYIAVQLAQLLCKSVTVYEIAASEGKTKFCHYYDKSPMCDGNTYHRFIDERDLLEKYSLVGNVLKTGVVKLNGFNNPNFCNNSIT